jgi:hypothetical protein
MSQSYTRKGACQTFFLLARPQAQDTRFDRASDGLWELLEGRSALGDGAKTEDADGVTMDRESRP